MEEPKTRVNRTRSTAVRHSDRLHLAHSPGGAIPELGRFQVSMPATRYFDCIVSFQSENGGIYIVYSKDPIVQSALQFLEANPVAFPELWTIIDGSLGSRL
jgi:hypothetical protein